MEISLSISNGEETREFYLPGMSVLSSVPGRIERVMTARLGDHTTLVSGPVPSRPIRSFYLPATAVLSNVPGQVERTVATLLRNHDTRSRVGMLREEFREFYLPATARFKSTRK